MPVRRLLGPAVTAALLGFIVACSGGDQPVGGLTADEARELHDAAAMLDANSVAADQLPEMGNQP